MVTANTATAAGPVGPAPPAPQTAHWLSTPHAIAFGVLWLAVHLLATLVWHPGVFHGAQLDPDGYMRLVRVDQLVSSGGWYNDTIARSNWPFGESQHWTRPLDVVILALMMPLRAFMDGARALATAGSIVSPLAHLALCVTAVWIVFPLVKGPERFLAMPAVLAQPLVFAYGKAGRADHHILIFLLFALAFGAWMRALLDPHNRRAAVAAGALSGIGIWVGPETLLPLGLLFFAGAIAWVMRGPHIARANVWLCIGLTIAVAAAVIIERPPATWLSAEFDKLSVAHLHVSLLALTFWWLALRRWTPTKGAAESTASWPARALFGLAGAFVAGAAILLLHPQFFRGPWVDVDPAVIDVWLQHVSELQPVFPTTAAGVGEFVAALGSAFIGLAAVTVWLRRERDPARRSVWILLFVSLLVYLPLAAAQLRFAPYAGIVAAVASVELLGRALARADLVPAGAARAASRIGLILAILLGAIVAGRGLSLVLGDDTGGATAAGESCDLTAIAPVLNDPAALGDRPRTIAAFIDFGPELLYRTQHRVLAGPYHRNRDGILAAHRMMTGDERQARAISDERRVDLVLLCPASDGEYFGVGGAGSLYARLLNDDVPDWIRPVEVPAAPPDFRLFELAGVGGWTQGD